MWKVKPSQGNPPAGERRGILVVDDNHTVRSVLQLALERSGFEVWLADDGREAIRLYRRHGARIAVVLLDVCMPGLDGPQTLEALREVNPDVRACFMSGSAAAEDQEELRRRGGAPVIAKPFPLEELANLLHTLAHRPPDGLPGSAPADYPPGRPR